MGPSLHQVSQGLNSPAQADCRASSAAVIDSFSLADPALSGPLLSSIGRALRSPVRRGPVLHAIGLSECVEKSFALLFSPATRPRHSTGRSPFVLSCLSYGGTVCVFTGGSPRTSRGSWTLTFVKASTAHGVIFINFHYSVLNMSIKAYCGVVCRILTNLLGVLSNLPPVYKPRSSLSTIDRKTSNPAEGINSCSRLSQCIVNIVLTYHTMIIL
jgi:hypothetical protein